MTVSKNNLKYVATLNVETINVVTMNYFSIYK
jgi:hypothetical protein